MGYRIMRSSWLAGGVLLISLGNDMESVWRIVVGVVWLMIYELLDLVRER